MRRTLEAIFRRIWSLCILLILLPLIGVGIAYLLPRSYSSSATIWALHRYTVVGSTGPESNLDATPSQTQTNALLELLHTRQFALNVARNTGLDQELSSSLAYKVNNVLRPGDVEDAVVSEVSSKIVVTPDGYNLLSISYANGNPQIAQRIVQNVITEYSGQSTNLSLYDGQRLLDSYQKELTKAKQGYNDAVVAEAGYLKGHPEALRTDAPYDPNYAHLHANTQQAQTSFQNIQTSIDNLRQQLASLGQGANDLFKVIDSTSDAKPVARMKSILLCAGVGLGCAVAAIVLYLVIAVRRDRAVYTASQIQLVTSLPILMQAPYIKESTNILSIE
ncbi:hypothetical protein KSC_049200 [Ktedonobacter sp. SOSP1-52]|uniref:hypothetical protein n=1 Tax=Ktedonobacter sp. SOSP1-52 TaxID=2778366 RepID=UPI00191625F6|nr:hypothetical protein [Ktedonobacter sp. SOSP1-52]GHO66028.1 hypothetical protein KSC_049200 [Ktedonobacter sp. SOSP1-52]